LFNKIFWGDIPVVGMVCFELFGGELPGVGMAGLTGL